MEGVRAQRSHLIVLHVQGHGGIILDKLADCANRFLCLSGDCQRVDSKIAGFAYGKGGWDGPEDQSIGVLEEAHPLEPFERSERVQSSVQTKDH